MTGNVIKYKLVHKHAKKPEFGYHTDACADLFSIERVEVPPRGYAVVDTGIIIDVPEGYELTIRPKSGLVFKHNIFSYPGTIDHGYHDSLVIKLFNFSDIRYIIEKGHKVCQIAVRPIPKIYFVEDNNIVSGVRGKNGFGSSGY